MNVFDRKLCRDLWQSKGMLGAIVAIVAVGAGCLVGFQGTYRDLEKAKSSYYARCRMADFWIDLKKIPVPQLEGLARVEGVSEIRHRIRFPVLVDLEGVERPLGGLLLSLPQRPAPVVNNIVLRRGGYFTGQRRNEVIVTEDFAKARGIRVGSTIDLLMGRQRKSLYVVGTAISSESIYMTPPGSIAPAPADYGVFYVEREFAADALGFQGAANDVAGLLTPRARERPQPVLDELERLLKPYGVFSVTPLDQQSSNVSLSSEMGGLSSMATMMPLVFLSVAALVLNVLMTRMAEQQRVVVGTLKALGYRTGELFAHYLKVGVAVGLAGALAGSLLGCGIAKALTDLYKSVFSFPRLTSDLYPDLMLLALGICLVFAVLGTAKGIRSILRLSPAEAMRPRAPSTGGSILLERLPGLWKRLGFRWQMVLRNLFRNRMRTAAGVFAAAMGSALLVCTLGSLDSLRYMVTFQFDKVTLSDFTLTFRDESGLDAVDDVRGLPGVERVEPVLNVPCTFRNGNRFKKGMVQGLVSGATMTVPREADGRAVQVPASGVLMTRRLASLLGLQPGDEVLVVPAKGEQRPVAVPVAGTMDSLIGLSVYADFRYLNRLVGEASAVSAVQVRAVQTPEQYDDFIGEIKRYPSLKTFLETAREKESMEATFIQKMGGMLYPMILFGAVIFFGAILNGSLIAIVERRREIATFRVLGYQASAVGNVFLRENIVQNMIGAVLGLPLGWWMLQGLAAEFTNDLYAMPCIVSPSSWAWSLGLALLFVLMAQWVVQKAVNGLDWSEALKMKE